jgi:hypothetical protein
VTSDESVSVDQRNSENPLAVVEGPEIMAIEQSETVTEPRENLPAKRKSIGCKPISRQRQRTPLLVDKSQPQRLFFQRNGSE